jgi:hypothetical protein
MSMAGDDVSERRAMSKAYRERRMLGGVYTITNVVTGGYLLDHAADLASVRNRFQFAVSTNSAVHPKLRADWQTLGAEAFRLEVREELEQGPEQTQAEFMEDLKALEQLVRASLDASKEY